MHEIRAWGNFKILHEAVTCKVKKIEVQPGHRLSYQSHNCRSEFWVIVQGLGLITIDGKTREVGYGEAISIPAKAKHRIKNIGNDILVFVEIQTGTSFAEEDIIRYDDDYGRS